MPWGSHIGEAEFQRAGDELGDVLDRGARRLLPDPREREREEREQARQAERDAYWQQRELDREAYFEQREAERQRDFAERDVGLW